MSQLRIYWAADWQDAASTCAWALLDERGALRESGASNLAAMPRADECVAVVAAEQVLCVPVALPKIKARQMETALPFALEEFLLGEAADSFVVPGHKLGNGETLLYSIGREKLRRFIRACESVSIRLRRAVPEYALLPVLPGEWSAVWDGQNGMLASGHYAGGVLGRGSAQQAPAALTLRLNSGAPGALRLAFKANTPADLREWPQWQGVSLIRGERDWDWRSAPLDAAAPNLLWGKFAAPARLQEWWPKLRPALLLLLLLFFIEALGNNLQWWSLAREKGQIRHDMDSVYQETFGAGATVVDAPLQMRRSLARARHAAGKSDDADFLPLLDRFAAEILALPGSKVNGLRYAEGQLDVEAHLPSSAAWETLQRRLGEQGMRAQVIDERDSGSALDVRLRLGAI